MTISKLTVVEKIGGASLSSEESYVKYADYLSQRILAGERLVVVISAQNGYTNRLLTEAKEQLPASTSQQISYILEGGEFRSAMILENKLSSHNVRVKSVSYEDIDLIANGENSFNANLVGVSREKLNIIVSDNDIVIVPGYGAIHEQNLEYVLLGRGATDYIAVALGAVLNCPVRFRKKSGKIFAVDPSILSNSLPLDHLSYGQARSFVEYSRPESQFLMIKCLDLAAHYHVPLYFLPDYKLNIDGVGTCIGVAHKIPNNRQFEVEPFRALAVQNVFLYSIAMSDVGNSTCIQKDLRVLGFSYGDFFEIQELNARHIFFTNTKNKIDEIKRTLYQYPAPTVYNCSSLTLIDSSIIPEGDHIFRGIRALKNINILASFSMGNTIRFFVPSDNQEDAVRVLSEEFNLIN